MSLDIYYNNYFVANEQLATHMGAGTTSHFSIEHAPMIHATMTGTVYLGNEAIQTFVARDQGYGIELRDIGDPKCKVISGAVDDETGIITCNWNEVPGSHRLVVAYEYEAPPTPVHTMARKDGTKFEIPTFKTFLSRIELEKIAESAGTYVQWDFNTALGDTIKEKYESLYVKCHELNNVLIAKGAAGYFWIVTSPEIASIFETATAGFSPLYIPSPINNSYFADDAIPYPQGIQEEIRCVGTMNSKWRLYIDPDMKVDLIMGANDKLGEFRHYGHMEIKNFII